MDLWSLKVLDSVVATGSISAAAVLVRRTQPQVSRIIRGLELELGFPLFVRHGRRLVPAPSCSAIIEHSRRVLDEMEALRVMAVQLRSDKPTSLHAVAPPYAFHGILPRSAAQFRTIRNDVRITLSALHRLENGSWAIPDHFDVGVGIMPFALPEITQEAVGSVEVALIVPKGHSLSSLPKARPEDVAPHPFVALRMAAPLRRRIDRIMEGAGLELDIVVTVPDTVSALRIVMEGGGVTLGDALSARQIGGDKVCLVPFEPSLRAPMGVFWPSTRTRSAVVDDFIGVIRQLLIDEQSDFVGV